MRVMQYLTLTLSSFSRLSSNPFQSTRARAGATHFMTYARSYAKDCVLTQKLTRAQATYFFPSLFAVMECQNWSEKKENKELAYTAFVHQTRLRIFSPDDWWDFIKHVRTLTAFSHRSRKIIILFVHSTVLRANSKKQKHPKLFFKRTITAISLNLCVCGPRYAIYKCIFSNVLHDLGEKWP